MLTVFGDMPDRFHQLAYRPVQWAVDGFGWLGAGLGSGAQGAQHFGGGAQRFGGAAEGGLGKVTIDLGVPGLVLFLWLAAVVIRQVWQRLRALSVASRGHATLAFGLAGILIANVATFAVATQVFGDLFVLILCGSALGFLLALPTVAWNEVVAVRSTPAMGAGSTSAQPIGPFPTSLPRPGE